MEQVIEREADQSGSPTALVFGQGQTPVGLATMAWDELGVRWLSFGPERDPQQSDDSVATQWPGVALTRNDVQAEELLRDAFHGELDRPLVLQGTPFQRAVWRALLTIEFAHTVSYGDLARGLQKPGASRAVGSAVGANLISFLVPCHRVLRADGVVGQYRWGRDIKEALLRWESGFGHRHVL